MTPIIIEIPNWTPTNLNVLLRLHWNARNERIKEDAAMVAAYAYQARAAKAEGPRKVLIECFVPGRLPDPDNLTKSILDALVRAGMLVDDSALWCTYDVVCLRGPRRTLLTLQDEES